MMQLSMFDLKGQPTSHAMRYVLPRYYHVEYINKRGIKCGYITLDVHKAIGRWLQYPKAKIHTRW